MHMNRHKIPYRLKNSKIRGLASHVDAFLTRYRRKTAKMRRYKAREAMATKAYLTIR